MIAIHFDIEEKTTFLRIQKVQKQNWLEQMRQNWLE